MTKNVILKSFPNGITVWLNPDMDFQTMKEEVKTSFHDAAAFFKNASVVLQITGKKLTDEECNSLVDSIREQCNLNILCLVCHDEEMNLYFQQILDQMDAREAEKKDACQFYKGTLCEGDVFESDHSLIVLGDVEKGSAVVSKGNLIVLGALNGMAQAGIGNSDAFVAALDFHPESLKIHDVRYKSAKKAFWNQKKKTAAQIAYLNHDRIVLEDLDFTEDLLRQLFG